MYLQHPLWVRGWGAKHSLPITNLAILGDPSPVSKRKNANCTAQQAEHRNAANHSLLLLLWTFLNVIGRQRHQIKISMQTSTSWPPLYLCTYCHLKSTNAFELMNFITKAQKTESLPIHILVQLHRWLTCSNSSRRPKIRQKPSWTSFAPEAA